MRRFRIDIEYDGTPFVGWQRQENGPSIQATIEEAIAAFSGEVVTLFGAGRTDAGVHALGQVAHFDLAKDTSPETVMNALNFHLRLTPVVVLRAAAVNADFHARFSALWRKYEYRILNRRAPPTVERDCVWHVPQRLNARAMHRAAKALVGRHDFTTFRSAQCQAASPEKTLDRLTVARRGDHLLVSAVARSFLHNQVRSMVGTLKRVGEGAWQEDAVATALAARDRSRAGPTAPAQGLYLLAVGYPKD
ncbi:MAG: tRNA pseudouridine(38-40) synthase TruA [Alphaproteobacteria bacterium]|nr:tRNA pseudouridine(38-40) synthase TruA [Alphaproteobacteria bacterium]